MGNEYTPTERQLIAHAVSLTRIQSARLRTNRVYDSAAWTGREPSWRTQYWRRPFSDLILALMALPYLLYWSSSASYTFREWRIHYWWRDLDQPFCCNGDECGCYSVSTREHLMWEAWPDYYKSGKFRDGYRR